jgi:hypothetical protein
MRPLLAALAACALLTGCATGAQQVHVAGDTYCRIARPITWGVLDTRLTIDQVRRHNAQHRATCGAKK